MGAIKRALFVEICIFLSQMGTYGLSFQQVDGTSDNNVFTLGDGVKLQMGSNSITLNIQNNNNNNILLTGFIRHDRETQDMTKCQPRGTNSEPGLCFQWENGPRLEVYKSDINRLGNSSNVQCFTVNWTLSEKIDDVKDTPEVCYSTEDNFWFGGFEESNQTWPLNSFKIGSTPFVTGEGTRNLDYGGVIEGLFISSAGFGIFVEETTPLYLSINEGNSKLLCFKGKVGDDTPFFQIARPHLVYDLCWASDITTLWKGMSDLYIPKPRSYPSEDVIRRPIWTTWALFKGKINQTIVLKFVEDIQKFNFSISQVEIDDNWTPLYGDFIFDTKTFPDAKKLIANLTDLGVPTTVWVHWFFNNDSNAFRELAQAGFLIREFDSDRPLLVPWWRGNYAGVLDFTNQDAVSWYLNKLADLKTNYGVTSFKFDAGEVKWVKQKRYKVKNDILTPNYLTTKYANATFQADVTERRQELRVGFRSQASSNMVRMFDRNSDWSSNLGIKSLIPCSLVFGFMGYPFILPDMIGGNAYGSSSIDQLVLPDSELFIRWLQANVFLPVLQFSIPPWVYKNDTITKISHKFVDLHEKYADKIIDLAKNAQRTGEPIVRPLWWIAPTDKNALSLDSEFLLGNDLLVAPILEKGGRSRDIYLPAGRWQDELRNVTLDGGTWLRNYKAALDELPYFIKL